jgi:hypothetical protein
MANNRLEKYSEYLTERVQSGFTFVDWYEHTYGEKPSEHEIREHSNFMQSVGRGLRVKKEAIIIMDHNRTPE